MAVSKTKKTTCTGCKSTSTKLECQKCVKIAIEEAVALAVKEARRSAYEHAADMCDDKSCNKWSNSACATMLRRYAKRV